MIIQGDPGEGKTTMVLQIIAKLTRGETILPKCNITVRKCEGHGKDLVPSVIKQTKNKLKQTY